MKKYTFLICIQEIVSSVLLIICTFTTLLQSSQFFYASPERYGSSYNLYLGYFLLNFVAIALAIVWVCQRREHQRVAFIGISISLLALLLNIAGLIKNGKHISDYHLGEAIPFATFTACITLLFLSKLMRNRKIS